MRFWKIGSGWIPVVLFLLVVISLCCSGTLSKKPPSRPISVLSRKIPVFRPLRRVIRNFIPSRKAFITIVFQRSVMPRIRWFRQTALRNLPNAELPNMISIDGDDRYRVRSISSHDITAVTLTIGGIENIFPVKLITCFSIDEIHFQYQLDTIIDEMTSIRHEKLDGILWSRTPPPLIIFNEMGQLSVACAARLESESSRFTDELNIYRSYLDRNQINGTNQVVSIGTGKIHKDRDNYAEESGKYTYQGRRQVLAGTGNPPHVLFEVSFRVLNGSQDDVGVYTCAGERAKDRTYISSWVKVDQQQAPALILLPCGDEMVTYPSGSPSTDSRFLTIHLSRERPTCIRCRAFDYESALYGASVHKQPITLSRNGRNIHRSEEFLLLDWHLNVADGGLTELTITFLKPSKADMGTYLCEARNSLGADRITFRVVVS